MANQNDKHTFGKLTAGISGSARVAPFKIILITALVNLGLYQLPLYTYALGYLNLSSVQGLITFALLNIVVLVITTTLFTMLYLISSHLFKLVCVLLAVTNACALYFMVNFSVILDKTMMANILNTRSSESFEFFSVKFALYVILLGLLPSFVLLRTRLQPQRRLRLTIQTTGLLVIALLCIVLNGSTWLWFDKHSKELGSRILPWSYVGNIVRLNAQKHQSQKTFTLLPTATFKDESPSLAVLVIGETARAANFSLYGYQRNTNPKLSKANISVLKNTKACSTYTVASLHCMLSREGGTSGSEEPLPSYLQRMGVDVFWRTNNWGEPPIDVASYLTAPDLRKSCVGEYCDLDDVLLSGIAEQIKSSTANKILLVLHTKGSHGPSYNTRYPTELEVFKPVCETVDLSQCSEQSLLNAYDNTIIYTDDFIDRTIQAISKLSDRPTMMMYISDHGESLGEFGLYLHGTPYAVAPDVQKDVPFLVWMSSSFQEKMQINKDDLEHQESHSHKQVFHSILGALGVQGDAYDEEQDIFKQ